MSMSNSFESLVDDIIRLIFEHASSNTIAFEDWHHDSILCHCPKEVLKLCAVCRKWKQVAQDHAILWTHICLRDFNLVNLQLRLSRNAFLQMLCENPVQSRSGMEPTTRQALNLLRQNIHRTSFLCLRPGILNTRLLADVLSYPAPYLETWRMVMPFDGFLQDDHDALSYPFRDVIPLLRRVCFQDYIPHENSKVWDNLYVADICLQGQNSMEREMVSFFQRSPKLQSLSSSGMKWTAKGSSTPCFQMFHLVSLQLRHVRDVDIVPLLQIIDFPALEVLAIMTDEKVQPHFTGFHGFLLASPGLRRFLAKLHYLTVVSYLSSKLLAYTLPHISLHLDFRESYRETHYKDILGLLPNIESISIELFPIQRQIFEVPDLGVSTSVKELRIERPIRSFSVLLQSLLKKELLPSLTKVFVRSSAFVLEEATWKIIYELLSLTKGQAPCIHIGGVEGNESTCMQKYFKERNVLVLVD